MISVNTLPDEVLLLIFDHYVNERINNPSYVNERINDASLMNGDINDAPYVIERREELWQSLVHVCCRWRSIVFGSPRHLKLQLVCQERTPARDTLDVWPALPLVIWCRGPDERGSVDNIIAGLERRDRVCQIILVGTRTPYLEILLAAMQQPFPELTHLVISPYINDYLVPVFPKSFLGGSAPRLEYLKLNRIPFPRLPKLLLSATHLTHLCLSNIPNSGYFSPKAIATALSVLTSLERLTLQFQSSPWLDRASRRPPPSTRSVLPVLGYFRFNGATKYLEDLVARIDSPRLNALEIVFSGEIVFHTRQLIQFINRTPMSRALEEANITFYDVSVEFNFGVLSQTSSYGRLDVEIYHRGLDRQLLSVAQVCTSCLPPLTILQDLFIYEQLHQDWNDNIENGLWLQLLHPFTAVKNLYLSKEVALRIGSALQDSELAEGGTTEVLPALQNLFLEGLESWEPVVQEGIAMFVAARQVASRPIAVSHWDGLDSDQDDSFQNYSFQDDSD